MQNESRDHARAEFEQVLSLNPCHAQATYQLSRAYARLGDDEKERFMQKMQAGSCMPREKRR